MALARTLAVALVGLDGHLVEVEAHLAAGLPAYTLVGLPDAALQEARDRVRAAVLNSGQDWPARRITVGLSPASLPKSGSGFDLAMAVAVLTAAGVVPEDRVRGRVFLGELGLDGRIRPVPGVLPAVLAAARRGHDQVVVPAGNAAEAGLVPGVDVHAACSLAGVVAALRGDVPPDEDPPAVLAQGTAHAPVAPALDLADVVGQLTGRRGMEVAAAGGHHVFLVGPPGVGKTMLAERLPGLLPDLDAESALEVTAVHSLAGALPTGGPLVARPPYCGPHHTASVAALVGGGSGLARPGAVSMAHRGVLFLDEAPEFQRNALEALRQPLEAGEVAIARRGGTTRYPARFLLVLAANPCPCGTDGQANAAACSCSPTARRRYLGKLSGPLLDRVDVRLQLRPVSRAELADDARLAEPTARVRARVEAARERAATRLCGTPWRTNGEVPASVLRRRWPVPVTALGELHRRFERGEVTARGVDRVLRVAWTIADLDGAAHPSDDHVQEALEFRMPAAVA